MMRLSWLMILALAVLTLLPAAANAQEQKFVLVNAKIHLTLRETKSTHAKAVDRLITYTPVEVIEDPDDKWAKVKTNEGKEGWVLDSYLTRHAFIHVDHDKLNVRRGPGTEYAVIMRYGRNFPLRVLDVARNGWLKVMDFEGDRGWIHPNLIEFEPFYVITRLPSSNIRAGVGTENPVKFTAERGTLFRVLEEKDGWLKVRYEDGDEGWISSKIVFGWRDVEDPNSTEE